MNSSRQAWSTFYRLKLGWRVKISMFNYTAPNGDEISVPFIMPKDLLQYLMTHHPDVMVGGLDSALERSVHLHAFWEGFRVKHPQHKIFDEHNNNLQSCLPVYWHGDEGRGKRRGNTCVVSIETPIGIHTLDETRKRSAPCDCSPPASLLQKFGKATKFVPSHLKRAMAQQRTAMKGHSFLQKWALIVLPTAIFKSYPGLLHKMLELIGNQLKELFYEGFEASGRHFSVGVCGAKGDLKWYCNKVANFNRSFEHQGITVDQPCCHECLAGTPGLPWEDISESPVWGPSRWSQRPWSQPPPMTVVPFDVSKPEFQYKRDPFHMAKVGIYRDLAGSIICYLAYKGYFGAAGTIEDKLRQGHSLFVMYCRATSKTPALRSFSKSLMTYPKLAVYPWSNTKGSDTMLLLQWLTVQLVGFQNDAPVGGCRIFLEQMRQTCQAAINIFAVLNRHGLYMSRNCGIMLYAEITRFLQGYMSLAHTTLQDTYNGFGLKPKLHLWKHSALDLFEILETGWDTIPNINSENCEPNEDYIGRVSRLSRRFGSQINIQRVLQACLLKSSLLHRRFRLAHKLKP